MYDVCIVDGFEPKVSTGIRPTTPIASVYLACTVRRKAETYQEKNAVATCPHPIVGGYQEISSSNLEKKTFFTLTLDGI